MATYPAPVEGGSSAGGLVASLEGSTLATVKAATYAQPTDKYGRLTGDWASRGLVHHGGYGHPTASLIEGPVDPVLSLVESTPILTPW